MRPHLLTLAACAALGVGPTLAAAATTDETTTVAEPANVQWSAKLRLQWDERRSADIGPLAQANREVSGTAEGSPSAGTALGELRGVGKGWQLTATLRHQSERGATATTRAWLNEAVLTHDAQSWQWSAGKKIVSWDVGYAFRPNNMVQQEERRTLVSSTPQGRPILMAERFDAETAWSWVWVNPTHERSTRGAAEPAMAARVYHRQGALDLHGFARWGGHTGASVGAALAWVPSDATELHASWRSLKRADVLRATAGVPDVTQASPWHATTVAHTTQALVGMTWTHESQFSVMAEAWWDGTALAPSDWRDWRSRNAYLPVLASRGVPAHAVAGNLAWQSDAFSAAGSLHQRNLYLRLSWEHDAWQPTLDVLYHPTDRGRLVTAGLLYKGDRYQVQAALRSTGGPKASVMAQLPTARQTNITYTLNY